MNIFALDYNTIQAARYHSDIHVRKMILETAQLLSTAYRLTTDNAPDFIYKVTHKNHPCSIWARSCVNNFNWLNMLGFELCREYYHRFGKDHKSSKIIDFFIDNDPSIYPKECMQFGKWRIQPMPQAMPEEYKRQDAVEAYRAYYMGAKTTDKNGKWMMCYTNREYPTWFPSDLIDKCEEYKAYRDEWLLTQSGSGK